jgi:hypothetical protein
VVAAHAKPVRRIALVALAGFESSLTGWTSYGGSLARVSGGSEGAWSARVTAANAGTVSIYPSPRQLTRTTAGVAYTATASVRTDLAGRTLCLQIREWASSAVGLSEKCVTGTSSWQPVPTVSYTAHASGNTLEAYVYEKGASKNDTYDVDAIFVSDGAAATSSSTPLAPANTALPTVSGGPTIRATFTASAGTWSNAPTAFAYAWQSCSTSGGSCADLAGATGASYVPAARDVGATLRVRVTATNSGGSTSATSAVTAQVTAPPAANGYYVSPAGDDANPGTLLAPWQTLRKALTSLVAGDVLHVRGGTYSERLGGSTPIAIHPGTASAPILVEAYPGERAVLAGLLWLNGPSYWTIDGLNVTWRSDGAATEHMVKITNGVGWRLTGSEIWGAHSYAGLLVAGTTAGEPAAWRVDHDCIHDTYATNSTNQDHNVYVNTGLSAGTGSIDHDMLFNATNGENVKLAGPTTGGGTANVTVSYNSLANAAQPILVGGQSSNISIFRNIVDGALNGYVFRGYELTGTGVAAHDNLAAGGSKLFWNDSASTTGIADAGGNVFPHDPSFDSVSCTGFAPLDGVAKTYGARASG